MNKNDNINKNEVQDIKRSDEYKYRLAANITVYHIISKLILQRIIITNLYGPRNHLWWSTISDLESPSNFQIKENFFYSIRSINKEIGLLWSWQSLGESTISIWIPIKFPSKKKNFIQIGPETTKLFNQKFNQKFN